MRLVKLLCTLNEDEADSYEKETKWEPAFRIDDAYGGRPVGDANKQDASGGPDYLTRGGQEGVPTDEPDEEWKPEDLKTRTPKQLFKKSVGEAMKVTDFPDDNPNAPENYETPFNVDGVDYNINTRVSYKDIDIPNTPKVSYNPRILYIQMAGGDGSENLGTQHRLNAFDFAMTIVEKEIEKFQPLELRLDLTPYMKLSSALTSKIPRYLPKGYQVRSFTKPHIWIITKGGKRARTMEVDHPEYMPDEGPARYDPAYDYPEVNQRQSNYNRGSTKP